MVADLNEVLKQLEATEANLVKLEKLWQAISKRIPKGWNYVADVEYDALCESFRSVLKHMPSVDQFEVSDCIYGLEDIARMRMDANEAGEIEFRLSTEQEVFSQAKELSAYRIRFNRKRREIVRRECLSLSKVVQDNLDSIKVQHEAGKVHMPKSHPEWEKMKTAVLQMDMLFGNSVPEPTRWNDLRRHLHFGDTCDLKNIIEDDWPAVQESLRKVLYTGVDPIPVGVKDISELDHQTSKGPVITRLNWSKLSGEQFERLVFDLVSQAEGYEQAEWLMHTNAPDRGRDLSVYRVTDDSLGPVKRRRVIIQCRNRTSSSVSIADIATLILQMKSWDKPRVDILVIATTGRFSTDAVGFIEDHNHSDHALAIEPWADSHLEKILIRRPDLIAEYGLRE